MSRRKQPANKPNVTPAPAPKVRLDRSRAFGKIVGSAEARFSQDGKMFDKKDEVINHTPVEMRTTIEA